MSIAPSSESPPYADRLTESDRVAIAQLLGASWSDEALKARAVGDLGLAATGETGEVQTAWRRRAIAIRRSVCRDPLVKDYCTDKVVETQLDIAFLVSGKLVADHFGGFDLFAAAALIAKMGLMTFCQEDDPDA